METIVVASLLMFTLNKLRKEELADVIAWLSAV